MQSDLTLSSLRIQNFRCFEQCDVDFHQRVTVFVADNARGKSAVLDAVAAALSRFVDELSGARQSTGITRSDVRLVRSGAGMIAQLPTKVIASGCIKGGDVNWGVSRKAHDQKSTFQTKEIQDLRESVNQIQGLLEKQNEIGQGEVLPIVSYYASSRFTDTSSSAKANLKAVRKLTGRMRGYLYHTRPLASFDLFNKWYKQTTEEIRLPQGSAPKGTIRPLELLTSVRESVRKLLEPAGWKEIDWDETEQTVVLEHPTRGRLPLGMLSSGVRSMVALTGDMAHRCARLNPHLGSDSARLTPGIVLIDEVDLHLHPSWQQLVIDLLLDAFPSIQFILTTHSPHVLSTVKAESIRIITFDAHQSRVETPQFQTRGVESADVLAAIMGVDPIPKVSEAKWLSDYRAMIEEGEHNSETANQLRDQLLAHFGEQHPVMLDCQRLIRFSEFKRRQATKGEENAQA